MARTRKGGTTQPPTISRHVAGDDKRGETRQSILSSLLDALLSDTAIFCAAWCLSCSPPPPLVSPWDIARKVTCACSWCDLDGWGRRARLAMRGQQMGRCFQGPASDRISFEVLQTRADGRTAPQIYDGSYDGPFSRFTQAAAVSFCSIKRNKLPRNRFAGISSGKDKAESSSSCVVVNGTPKGSPSHKSHHL